MDEFTHLLTNPAHWAFEGVTDITFGLIGYLIGRKPFHRWLDRGHPGPRHLPKADKA